MVDESPNRAIPVERPGVADSAQFVAQSERVERTLRGPRRIVKGYVRGLVGADDRRMWSATFATGIPNLGAPDDVAEGAILGRISIDQRTDSPSQAEAELEYGFFAEDEFINDPGTEPELAQIEVISTVVPVTTDYDVFGRPMILQHEFQSFDDADQPLPPVRAPDQAGEVEYHLPNHVVVFRRREPDSPGATGRDGNFNKSKHYVGSINRDKVFGDQKHMWMCTRLDGRSDDGGQSYMVTYEFQRNEDSWNPVLVYRDPKTGAPVLDPKVSAKVKGNVVDPLDTVFGRRPFQIYRDTVFHDLDLWVTGTIEN